MHGLVNHPHPERPHETGGDQLKMKLMFEDVCACSLGRGVRLRAGTIDGPASCALTSVCPNRDRLSEPLDVRDVVRLSGQKTTGI